MVLCTWYIVHRISNLTFNLLKFVFRSKIQKLCISSKTKIVLKRHFFLFLFLLPFFTEGQILNIERSRLQKDTAKVFLFKANAGLNVYNRSAAADAPVNLFGYNIDLNALYYPGKHGYMFISKFDYLKINDSDFLNFGMVHARANFLRDRKVNYETFVQYSFDNFRGLDPRWIAGGSVRHSLIKTKKLSFLYGIGGMYEFEKWQVPNSEQFIEVNFFKSSNYLSLRATINEYVDFNMVNYYQVGYDRGISAFRHRISNSTILNTKLTERFSITNTFEISYEDRPIVPITNVIYSFRTGLSLNF